ncbi:MAG TPA: malto-oligosyltrehalose trehalohydrolase, partial [Alphaproteobacteria bacterium]|nr:malto-oligosyltrehalose trehalohydrolase [Alphaproteobacteria bacterium]
GGPALPDPRSRWQPEGVHGPSRVLDTGSLAWSDAGFEAPPLASGLVYELHVGTFTPEGTFDAATRRLDALADLGVTHVELMPVAEFPGRHGWGYDGVDLFAPHHAYGGPEGLARVVDACHARGLAVLLDVVYNHLGPDGNHLARFGPYFTDRHATPWGPAVNLDGRGSDEVRRFLCDNALMWLRDYHFDGLRIDAVHAIVDTSAVHFLEQLAEEVRTLEATSGRHLVLIAESDLNDPRVIRPPALGGYGLDAQWNDDFHHAVHAVLTGERLGYYADFGQLADVAKALDSAFVYDGRYSRHRGRRHGRAPAGESGRRFVGFVQNHDQVGNRARGERLCHLVSPAGARLAAAVLLTAPFVPMLFMGEEWGASTPFLYFTDHVDPSLARRVSEGRRREFAAFGWDPADVPDPQAPETFARSRLDWDERARPPHRDLLAWHRDLIRLRRSRPELCDGRLDRVRTRWDGESGWLVFERGQVVIACNFSREACSVPLGGTPRTLLLGSDEGIAIAESTHLPAEAVAIVEMEC